MHILQKKILEVAEKVDLSKCGLRKLGNLVEETHPQKIKHHLSQLEQKGCVELNKEKTRIIKLLKNSKKINDVRLFRIPIFGYASCGPATMIAEQNPEGYLSVSRSVLENRNVKGLFVIRAVGDSLNRARNINGGNIEDGDFVIIDGNKKNPNDGEYVLSVIDDVANLKRFYKNEKEIRLVSESSLNIQPIILDKRDLATFNYVINGVILRVIKQ